MLKSLKKFVFCSKICTFVIEKPVLFIEGQKSNKDNKR